MGTTPKEGMHIHVYSPDKMHDLGHGIIERVEPLRIEELGLTISTYPSRILLDSGKVTEGCNCWWIPEELEGKLKSKLKKARNVGKHLKYY